MSKVTQCKDCGSELVGWKQSKTGKWYLANASRPLQNSHQLLVTNQPHYLTCTAKKG